jgi:hypothetical protein
MDKRWIVIAALVAAGIVLSGNWTSVPKPAPGGPDLLSVFRKKDDTEHAKRDARAFAAICRAIKKTLEFDWRQPAPRLSTGVKADDLTRAVRELRMEGYSFADDYPDLKEAIRSHFEKKGVGTKGGTLSDDRRRAWLEALGELSVSADYAAEAL